MDSDKDKAPEGKHDPDPNPLWNQLENAVAMAAKQDQIVWAIFAVFCAAEAVLLAGLFQNGTAPVGVVGPLLSSAGVFISVVWFFIQWRAREWLEFYERRMRKLEAKLDPAVRLMIPEENDPKYQEIKNEPGMKVGARKVRGLMVWCAPIFGFCWLVAAIAWSVWLCAHREPVVQQQDIPVPFKVRSVGAFEIQGSNILSDTFRGTIKSVAGNWVLMEDSSTNSKALWLNTDQAVTWSPDANPAVSK